MASVLTNLVTNPSFETGTAGVLTAQGTTLELSPDVAVAGAVGLLVTVGDAPTETETVGQAVEVTAGQWVAWRVPVTALAGDYRFRSRAVFTDAAGALVAEGAWSEYVDATQAIPAVLVAAAEVPAGATTARVEIAVHSAADSDTPPAGAQYSTDAWIVATAAGDAEALGSVATYFDGNTPTTDQWRYAWTGEPDASTSTATSRSTAATVRTNLIPNPSFEKGLTGWRSPNLRTMAEHYVGNASVQVTATSTAAPAHYQNIGALPVVSGQTYALAAWVKGKGTTIGKQVRIRFTVRNASNAVVAGGDSYGANVTLTDEWQRVTHIRTTPVDDAVARADMGVAGSGSGWAAGDTFYVDAVLVELADQVGDYFDGDTTSSLDLYHTWTGTPHASTSMESDGTVSITASYTNTSLRPTPVQVVLSNIPDGVAYKVTGIGTGGRTWDIAGGTGVSEGKQIVLIDTRAPLNMPIRYRLVVSAGAVDSNALAGVDWAPDGASGKFLVQSLNGSVVVPIGAWIDNQLPKDPVLHAATFDVRGRRRPVMVLATAGDGTMAVQWRLDRAASSLLDGILADGGGIVVRTDGNARDLPASDVAVITSASNQLWRGHHGVSTDRVWDLELTWIDDPEPSSVPVVWSVDQVDTILAGRTVDQVDGMFADLSVNEVDALDFGTLTTPDVDPPLIIPEQSGAGS